MQCVFILGTHPALSHAELEAVLDVPVERRHSLAFAELPDDFDARTLMEQLGGTIKIAELLGDFNEDTLVDTLFEKLNSDTKFHFGFSLYPAEPGIPTKKDWKKIQQMGLKLKRSLKKNAISARYVQSKEVVLSSVIVHKERLLKNGMEIVLLKGHDNTQLARTLAVQPFQDFSKRDFGRPGRDSRSGMLPPKLARMMVNIAAPAKDDAILDPFCGSGTLLQEALLLGHTNVTGSDKSKKAVEDSLKNLKWMELPRINVYESAAQQLINKDIVKTASVDRIIFEGYLGPPTPKAHMLASARKEMQRLYETVFPILAGTLSKDGRIVAALPFWKTKAGEEHLDMHSIVSAAGLHMTADPLLYRRPQSTVGREIIQLEK
jgi:tRNA (guanine10-N2)-dimethyltransferase